MLAGSIGLPLSLLYCPEEVIGVPLSFNLCSLQTKARVCKAAADRWTDNVWTIKAKLQRDFGREASEVDAMMGIDDAFDYVK